MAADSHALPHVARRRFGAPAEVSGVRLVREMAFRNLWNPTAPRRRGFQRVQVFEMGQIGPEVREESAQACLERNWFSLRDSPGCNLDLIRP